MGVSCDLKKEKGLMVVLLFKGARRMGGIDARPRVRDRHSNTESVSKKQRTSFLTDALAILVRRA